jgi:hypothetical protein
MCLYVCIYIFVSSIATNPTDVVELGFHEWGEFVEDRSTGVYAEKLFSSLMALRHSA